MLLIVLVNAMKPPGGDGLSKLLTWVLWFAAVFCLWMAIIAAPRMKASRRDGDKQANATPVGMAVTGFFLCVAAIIALAVAFGSPRSAPRSGRSSSSEPADCAVVAGDGPEG